MKYKLIISLAASIALAGCAGARLDTKKVNQSQTWKIESVKTFNKDGVTQVSGQMKKSKRFAARKGHIDIAIFSIKGELISKKLAPLGKRVMRRGGDYFSVYLREMAPEDASIEVSYHNESLDNCGFISSDVASSS